MESIMETPVLTPEKIERQTARRHQVRKEVLGPIEKKMSTGGKLWVAFLLIVILIGAYAWYLQLKEGAIVTGLNNVSSWGLSIVTFVFFVAISLIGALMSGILRLANATTQRPIARIAEIISLAAVICAPLMVLNILGRPDRFPNLFLHAQIQSPIFWDVLVVITYLIVSALLFYVPCLPGMAICRNALTDKPKWQKWLYRVLALNWNGLPTQWKIMKRSYAILCVLVIPIGVSIHTVTSWLFATIYRPGWDSTNFGAYFVTGAFLAGLGCLIIAVYVFRNIYRLKNYLTEEHFDLMGKLMVTLAAVYLYFSINEYFIPYYKMKEHEAHILHNLFFGKYAALFWLSQIFGVLLPLLLPIFKSMRKPKPLFIGAVLLVVFHWVKRFLIVTPTSEITFLPMGTTLYIPSWVELSIVLGSIATMLLIITIMARLFPIISIWEYLENEGIELEELDKLKTKRT